MAAIRILLPGRSEACVIALTGPRITVGRSPDNTIQIADRIVSVRHADLIKTEDHYRLHDLDSTNGVFVNGQQVSDFHLREACRVAFGTFECEFLPELPADWSGPVEVLPSRAEVRAVGTENSRLKAEVAKHCAEIDELRATVASLEQAGASAVPRERHESVLAERAELKEACARMESRLVQERAELATLRAERDTLQRALAAAVAAAEARVETIRGELESVRESQSLQVAASVPRTVHQELIAENASLRQSHEKREAELVLLNRQLAESQTVRASLEQQLRVHEQELADQLAQNRAELAAVRADRDELQRGFDAAEAGAEAHAEKMRGELKSLREMQAAQAASSIPRSEHEKLVGEHASLQKVRQEREAELVDLNRQLMEFQTLRADLELQLRAKEHELAEARSRMTLDGVAASEQPGASHPEALAAQDEQAAERQPSPPGQLEEVLGKLGFQIRPVRLPVRAVDKNGEGSSTAPPVREKGQVD